ncbi:MAG: UDP-N-acetylmuramoyl-L-alanyl-D-glutamate--2,6-diaminopimelate ligase, partial [Nocardioides sp.]
LTDPAGARLLPPGFPALVVADPRRVLGALSAQIYAHPAERMRTIGVTGTQGKTTTTRLLLAALEAMGHRVGAIGTVGTRIAGRDVASGLTTPEAPDLQALMAVMVEAGVTDCVMEVSSHALVKGRVDGVRFDVAGFANLGRDHLDFHESVEDYFAAKATLFTPERARAGVVNADDIYGQRLVRQAGIPLRTMSLPTPDDQSTSADWWLSAVDLGPMGSRALVHGPGLPSEGVRLELSMPGDFNLANALLAIACGAEAGHDPAELVAAMARAKGVPGRLERVEAGQDFVVLVDYAHKPDAVEATLLTLRPLTRGRLILVLGAGGDRDSGKRPVMGRIAGELADLVVITDDNPRSEEPAAIRAAVLAGVVGPGEAVEIGDRRAAIRYAVTQAQADDVVVIAGKGHESGQDVGGVITPFDDRLVAAEELGARARNPSGAP